MFKLFIPFIVSSSFLIAMENSSPAQESSAEKPYEDPREIIKTAIISPNNLSENDIYRFKYSLNFLIGNEDKFNIVKQGHLNPVLHLAIRYNKSGRNNELIKILIEYGVKADYPHALYYYENSPNRELIDIIFKNLQFTEKDLLAAMKQNRKDIVCLLLENLHGLENKLDIDVYSFFLLESVISYQSSSMLGSLLAHHKETLVKDSKKFDEIKNKMDLRLLESSAQKTPDGDLLVSATNIMLLPARLRILSNDVLLKFLIDRAQQNSLTLDDFNYFSKFFNYDYMKETKFKNLFFNQFAQIQRIDIMSCSSYQNIINIIGPKEDDPCAGETVNKDRSCLDIKSSDNDYKKTIAIKVFEKNNALSNNSTEIIIKNWLTIFNNINDPSLLQGLNVSVTSNHNKEGDIINIFFKGSDAKLINNITYNTITGYRIPAIQQDSRKISINVDNLNVDTEKLNDTLIRNIKKRIKNIKFPTSIQDDTSYTTDYLLTYNNTNVAKKKYVKHSKNQGTFTAFDSKIEKTDKRHKNPQKNKSPRTNKTKQVNNKNQKSIMSSTTSVINPTTSMKKDKVKKEEVKFNPNYLLSMPNVDPIDYPSQFVRPNNVEEISLNHDLKKISHKKIITLFSNYYNLFNRISDHKKEIFNHGILAIDFTSNSGNYIEYINYGLLNFDNHIIPELNNIYNEFNKRYDNYLNDNIADRISQINALIDILNEYYEEILSDEGAIKGYLFILGEHISRLMTNNQEQINNIINSPRLLLDIKNFRNAAKHGKDNQVKHGEITYIVGDEPLYQGKELLEKLLKEIEDSL